jgi:hypothetical protein
MNSNKQVVIDSKTHHLERIPRELKELPQWMPFKLEPRPNSIKKSKVPKYNGHTASKSDSKNWLSYQDCLNQFEDGRYGYDGIGFCPNGSNLLFIDLDDCFDEGGQLHERAREIVDSIDGYVERSLSGNGLHIVTLTDKHYGNPKSADGKVEIFTDRMYLAMTGDVFEGKSQIPLFPAKTSALDQHIHKHPESKPYDAFEIYSKRDSHLTLEKAEEILMGQLIPNPERGDWLQLGMALHFQFIGDFDALMLWDKYSARDGAGNYLGLSDLEKQWNGFRLNHPNPITFASIYQKLKKPELTEAEVWEEAKPIQYDLDKPKPIRYLLNGFMTEGITSIAGASGAGKTTMVVELASIVAHLCDESKVGSDLDKHFLKVRGRRKVIHFTEHADQIEQVLYGKRKFGKNHSAITCGTEEANEWYIVVPTKKYTSTQLAGLVSGYSKKHTVTWPTGRFDQSGNEVNVEMPPLLIFDTASASFSLDDENSNSEQSKMIASIKEVIRELKSSIWIITHVAKAAKSLDLKQQSSRGAGAIEADVQTAASLGREIGAKCSVLSITKNRIQTDFDEINFISTFHKSQVEDEWGDWQPITYITGELIKSTSVQRIQQKADSKKEGAELAKKYSIKQRAISIVDLLKNTTGKELYNQEDIQVVLGGNVAINRAATGLLKAQGYIINKRLDKAESEVNGGKRRAIVLSSKPFDEATLEDGNV